MIEPVKLTDLEIAGYADVVPISMTPSVVPPVFLSKSDPNRAYLPPYHMNNGFLYNAKEVTWREVENLVTAERITLLPGRLAAQPEFELWIDCAFKVHYQLETEVERELDRIGHHAMRDAEQSLRGGDLAEAERHSSTAANANDTKPGPFALQAAIDRHRGNQVGEELMAEVAGSMCEEKEFEILVEYYYDLYSTKVIN